MSSRFGQLFSIATFGESHGGAVGVVVDGCPPRLALAAEEIQRDLDRRRPGQSRLTTPRDEADRVEILSGVFEGHTLGTPIALLVRNEDARPEAYAAMKDVYRLGNHLVWVAPNGTALIIDQNAGTEELDDKAIEALFVAKK